MRTELIHSYSTASLSSVFSHTFNEAEDDSNEFTQTNNNTSSTTDKSGTTNYIQTIRDWSKNNLKKKLLVRKLPILSWISSYNLGFLVADIIAGLTVGLTLLPQGLAYASIAKVPPQVCLCF